MDGSQERDRPVGAVPDPPAAEERGEGNRKAKRPLLVFAETEGGDAIELRDQEPAPAHFRADVLRGLGSEPKYLPSQYLYDARGAKLFEEICALEEYYLTRTEFSILRSNLPSIARHIGPEAAVIEPGSGSGVKAQLLLSGLERPVGFVPVDIARAQLVEVAARIKERAPDVQVMPVCADFTVGFGLPPAVRAARRRIGFLPGSTIGNFEPPAAVEVLRDLVRVCGEGAGVLIGVDLKKSRAILEPAYDDSRGVSRAFALNYLRRLNEELGADFDRSRFGYQAPYVERHGRVEMSLVSECAQEVHVGAATFSFAAGELVSTEWSYKYDLPSFAALARLAGLRVREVWTDPGRFFSVQYLVPA